MGKRLSEVFY